MIENTNELLEYAVKEGQIPRYLYRYRPFNDDTINELKQGYLWFSNVEDYNDPFEGILKFDIESTEDELLNFIVKADHENRLTHSEALEIVKHYHSKPNELKERLNKVKAKIHEKIRLCSFTTKPDNLLMWSHYASGHSGICIKYDIFKLVNDNFVPAKVLYTKDYPKFNYIKESENALKLARESVQKKSTDWAYEDEYRLVSYPKTDNKVFLRKGALVELILGSRITEENIKGLKEAILNNPYQNPEIKNARLMEKEFKLEIK